MSAGATDPADASADMYGPELAPWFHLLTAPADYAGEAAWILSAIRERSASPPGTLLELGSGGGNNASHLKPHLRLTLVDLSQAMLDVSRRINPEPEIEHLQGDMRTVRLGRTFDAVLVHDAVVYMATEADLSATLVTVAAHLAPSGVAIVAPDFVRETFAPGTSHGGHDDVASGRGLRYVEWTHDPEPSDTSHVVDFAFLLRDRDGSVTVKRDRREHGLFSREQWLRLHHQAGLQAETVRDEWNRDVFVSRLAAAS